MGSTTEAVGQALAGPLANLGLDLEAVELTPAGKRRVLRVAVDKDGGVTLDDVADATREVGRVLDESDVMGASPYTLEVTSRGVDRPLTAPRHWRRNVGRLVRVTGPDSPDSPDGAPGAAVTGRLVAADDDADGGATLELPTGSRRFPYAEVVKAVVQVELTRPRSEEDD